MEHDFLIITEDETEKLKLEFERQKKIDHFQNQIHDIAEMFEDLKTMVEDDELQLEDIFEMVNDTKDELDLAEEELHTIEEYQASVLKKRMMLYTFFIMSGLFTFKLGTSYLLFKVL